jgi:hypothetical protein
VKAVDSHRDRLEPLFDVVPLCVVELTAQIMPKEGSQIPTSIDQKLSVCHVMFLGKPMQKRRRGIGPAAAVYIDFEQ